MGVNVLGARFLLHAADLGANFDKTATLGHLSLSCDTADIAEALAATRGESPEVAAEVFRDCARFADGIFRYLGAQASPILKLLPNDDVRVGRADRARGRIQPTPGIERLCHRLDAP